MPIRVKICGITTPADAELAARLGADAIGLNFYDKSPRFVDTALATDVLQVLPPFVEPVAVLVNPGSWNLASWFKLKIRTIQIHGLTLESPTFKSETLDFKVVIAVGISGLYQLEELAKLIESRRAAGDPPAAILADARVPGLYGGTGQTAPWDLLAPHPFDLPLILAGGLTPDNVGEAIRIVRPYAVDVASGVERAPGVKDEEKLRRFIGNAREAAENYL